jgi:hypothetical protein
MTDAAAEAPIASPESWAWWTARLRAAWAQPELRWLALICVVATVFRIWWVLYAARAPQGLHDPLLYDLLARQIASGNGYHYPDGPTAFYPVGFPALLGGLYFAIEQSFIPDNHVLATAYLQVFLSVATVALTYGVASRLFNATVGLVAAAWLALFPNLIYHMTTYLTETLFLFLVMLAIFLLFGESWRERKIEPWRVIAFGVVLGLSALVRPISVLLIPALLVALFAGGFGWRRAFAYAGASFALMVAVIAPWTLRNIVVMDSPIIISANVGDDLCIGHHRGAPGHFAVPNSCFAGYDDLQRPEFEVERNNDNLRRAIRFALDEPLAELRLLSRKAYYMWEHDHDGIIAAESYGEDGFIDPDARRFLTRTADIYFYATISIGALGLLGLVLRFFDARRFFFLLGLLAFAGVPLVFFGDTRFHVPVMPFLAVTAAWLVVTVIGLVRASIDEREPRPPRVSSASAGSPGGTFGALSPRRPSDVEVAEGEAPVADENAL